jgi:DNA invertase Pin-like site-specific DNA recombinase
VALLPVAEYLRMSTDHQKYSLDNQAASIRQYAGLRGFEVVQTYADPGRSGLVLKHRRGLADLLRDVVGAPQLYKAILVYDVSRWGRFQDTDESAYYEYLCKAAGFPIHYCAETFVNDGAMPNVVMKALKRVMAAEYSRDLSCKVFEGSKRLNEMGFRTGGLAGYGLRRMLYDGEGNPKQLLKFGEHKSVVTDRVKLVLGPPEEVLYVREIYQMVITRMTLGQIAANLNSRGVTQYGRRWTRSAVYGVATNPKYIGLLRWGYNAKKLGGPVRRQPEQSWIMKKRAFEPIVDEATFREAQLILRHSKTDEQLLDCLRRLLQEKGRLGRNVFDAQRKYPCEQTYVSRFGSLTKAYELIGYSNSKRPKVAEIVRRLRQLRENVVQEVTAIFPTQVRLLQRNLQYRPVLELASGMKLRVVVFQTTTTRRGAIRWILPSQAVRSEPTLLCRCNAANTAILDYYLVSRLQRWLPRLPEQPRLTAQLRFKEDDRLFREGSRLESLSTLLDVIGAKFPQLA